MYVKSYSLVLKMKKHSFQEGTSPLHLAVKKGYTDVVNILVMHGANVDTKDLVRNL